MLGHILRHIGADAKVADVHHGDIVALHRAITDSGHPVLANRTVACASADVLARAQADGRRGQAVARSGAGQPVQGD